MRSIDLGRGEVVLYKSWDWVHKSMAMTLWKIERSFYWILHRTRIDWFYHMTGMRFDELTLTLILSELTIEEPNHMITTPRGSSFSSVRLSLHTARCHWWIMGSIKIISMIDNSNWMNWKEFQSIKKNFDDVGDKDYNISHYQTELDLWSHTNKDIGLGLHN